MAFSHRFSRFEAGDLNIYRYTWNNPVNWTDPSGMNSSKEYALIATGVALVATAVTYQQLSMHFSDKLQMSGEQLSYFVKNAHESIMRLASSRGTLGDLNGVTLAALGAKMLTEIANPDDQPDDETGGGESGSSDGNAGGNEKANSPVWQGAEPFRGKTKTNGKKGRKREYYEWDYEHGGEIEVYDHKGKHKGVKDPKSGEWKKDRFPAES